MEASGFAAWHPLLQALVATLFTWFVTAVGAAGVFLAREPSRRVQEIMLGFAAGVMIAASYWSLLAPAIEMSEGGPVPAWIPATVGFLVGGGFLWLMDELLPHLHPAFAESQETHGLSSHWRRSTLLFVAITLHNIPEGLAVGVAFGAVAAGIPEASLTGAIALAIGIGLQNFPEGLAIAMPLRTAGMSARKAFLWGQGSALVEPIAGVIGAGVVLLMRALLPYALAFAAGAMIFVVVEELVPEGHRSGRGNVATIGALLGFTVMMVLDVALG